MLVKDKQMKLFTEIEKKRKLKVFDNISAKDLDTYFNINFASFELSPLGETDDSTLSGVIIGLFANDWDTIYDYDMMVCKNKFATTETLVADGMESVDRSENRDTLDKLSGYDAETLKDNSQSVETNKGLETRDTNETHTRTKLSPYNSSQVVNYLNKHYVSDVIFTDLLKVLFIKIF